MADCQISGIEEFQVLLRGHACSAQCRSYPAGLRLESDSTYGASYFVAKGLVNLAKYSDREELKTEIKIIEHQVVNENEWFELPAATHFTLEFKEETLLLELVFDSLEQMIDEALGEALGTAS